MGQWLEDKEYFLVQVDVDKENKITVEIDHEDGVWIEDCVQLSRFIEEHFNRDEEDFELEVGSAGLGQPFKVERQYTNHIGKEVEVLDKAGKKHRGVLKSVADGAFVLEEKEKVVPEGKKRPVWQPVDRQYIISEVKYTKYLIKF